MGDESEFLSVDITIFGDTVVACVEGHDKDPDDDAGAVLVWVVRPLGAKEDTDAGAANAIECSGTTWTQKHKGTPMSLPIIRYSALLWHRKTI
jgi:hypothetical protein